jgi:2-amino-4-hydroxy-6-hydroxymethyldihydropteridine diphosphokinase
MDIALGIGSNLGDRLANINLATKLLSKELIQGKLITSSIYETTALLKEGSPPEWDLNFYNLVIKGKTSLSPLDILKKIKIIEDRIAIRDKEIWSPRAIDIDILAYGEEIIIEKDLFIPHKELLNRKWCVIPFSEVFPGWKYPISGKHFGKTITELAQTLAFNQDDLFKKLA